VLALIFGLCADVWKNLLQLRIRLVSYTSFSRENGQQKSRNRVSECSFSPLSASVSTIIATASI